MIIILLVQYIMRALFVSLFISIFYIIFFPTLYSISLCVYMLELPFGSQLGFPLIFLVPSYTLGEYLNHLFWLLP